MARIHCNFFSEVLRLHSHMTVLLPQRMVGEYRGRNAPRAAPWPTLWLLHGLSDDDTAWTRKTALERYVEPLGLAVVMPAVGRSFYADMAHGHDYFTFVSDELPRIAREMFSLSDRREDNVVAGNSMGGYGALKLALNFPKRYAAAASFSGAVDGVALARRSEEPMRTELKRAFGDLGNTAKPENDLLHLVEKVAGECDAPPKLYHCCGASDPLYDDNIRFRDLALNLDVDLTFEEHDAGHTWEYWDRMLPRVLGWLPL